MKSSQTSALSPMLVSMVTTVREDGYPDIAEKIHELLETEHAGDRRIRVAFCGLFSAGKTSLLRVLCQREDLKTAAVPTTDEVVEISLPGTEVLCLDTPGVDSTDAAHQAATEAALHRAHAIVLVMDYQQVESDMNLELAQSFALQDKPLYLVVNQVDKHLEWELPFAQYQQRIEQTFADWDVVYARIFYTSTRTVNDEGLAQFSQTLKKLANDLNPAHTITLSLRNLISQYTNQKFAGRLEEASSRCHDVLSATPYDKPEATSWIVDREGRISEKTRQLEEHLEQLRVNEQTFLDSVLRTIDLAQIAPYDTTEKGRRYIESLRDGFKVGWFRSKDATLRERNLRQQAFIEDLSNRTQQYLVLPIQSLLREASLWPTAVQNAWLTEVEALSVGVDDKLCSAEVKRGALMSDQYPYQYVKDVVQAIKSSLRGKVVAKIEELLHLSTNHLEEEAYESTEFRQIQAELEVLQDFVALQDEVADEVHRWMDVLQQELGQDLEVAVGGDTRG